LVGGAALGAPFVFLVAFLAALPRVNAAYGPVDASELLSAGLVLGVAHPPGYLFLSLLERLALLVPAGGPAFRMNLVGPCALALSAVVFLGLARRVVPAGPAFGLAALLAFSPPLLGACGDAKGAAMLVTLALFIGVMRVAFAPAWTAGTRAIAGLLLGISAAHNALAVLPALAGAAAFLPRPRGSRGSPVRDHAIAVVLAVAGVSVLVCGAVRAAAAPAVNWGRWDRLEGLVAILSWARGWPEFGAGGVAEHFRAVTAYGGVPLVMAGVAVLGWAFGARWPGAKTGPRFIAVSSVAFLLLLLPHDLREPGLFYTLPLVPCALAGLALLPPFVAAAKRHAVPLAASFGALAVALMAAGAPPGAGRWYFMDDLARNTLAEVPDGKAVLFVLGDYDHDAIRFRQLAYGEKTDCALVRVTVLDFPVYGNHLARLKAVHPWLALSPAGGKAGPASIARLNSGQAWVGATAALRAGGDAWPGLYALSAPGGSFTVPLGGSRPRGSIARARSRDLFDERLYSEEWARRFRRTWRHASLGAAALGAGREGPFSAF
jgi:hypothetical protein